MTLLRLFHLLQEKYVWRDIVTVSACLWEEKSW